MSSPLFQGRIAVVTGAASGIGLGVARRFVEEGAAVALLDRDEVRGPQACRDLLSLGGVCEFYSVDVASEADVMRAMANVFLRFGRVDHLVNSAGIVVVQGIEECTASEWTRVMDVNVKSVFLTVKHSLSLLRHSPAPSIVNLGSVSGLVAQKRTLAYVASKGAVRMLSKALALDLAEEGIRVNCVCPGITDTPMLSFHLHSNPDPEDALRTRCNRVPLGRMLSPEEIADAVLYLCSDRASGITGTDLVVDGGYTAAAEWSRNSPVREHGADIRHSVSERHPSRVKEV